MNMKRDFFKGLKVIRTYHFEWFFATELMLFLSDPRKILARARFALTGDLKLRQGIPVVLLVTMAEKNSLSYKAT